jgi:hypothetical protein
MPKRYAAGEAISRDGRDTSFARSRRAVIASQITAVDRAFLAERVGKLVPKDLAQVMSGVDIALGR